MSTQAPSATPASTDYFSPRTKHLVKNYAITGGKLGLGAVAITSAVNYLNYLKEKKHRERGSAYDDSVMYIDVPVDGVGTKKASIGGGLGLAAGTLGAVGTYMLGKKIYDKLKKKVLQKELDEAQKLHMETLTGALSSPVKMASATGGKPMSVPELVTSMPITATLLAAVASGVITNRALDHTFPSANNDNKKGPLKPKQIRIRYTEDGKPIGGEDPIVTGAQNKQTKKEEDSYDKYASDSFVLNEFDERQSLAFLCNIVLGFNKSASESFLPDVIGAVMAGRLEELEHNITDLSPATAFEMTKGASVYFENAPQSAKELGVALAISSDILRPCLSLVAAAEFADSCPSFHQMGAALPMRDSNGIVKVAAAINAGNLASTLKSILGEDDSEEDVETDPTLLPEGEVNQSFTARQLLQRLIAQEMSKDSPEGVQREEDNKNDVIDTMLAK
jgi:hypothetical protein